MCMINGGFDFRDWVLFFYIYTLFFEIAGRVYVRCGELLVFLMWFGILMNVWVNGIKVVFGFLIFFRCGGVFIYIMKELVLVFLV